MYVVPEFRGNTPRHLDDLREWVGRLHEAALEPDLPIVDPHHHLWDNEHGRYLLDDFLVDLASGHNVMSTVFVQAQSMYRAHGPEWMKPVGEVEFANGVAAASASGQYGNTRVCEGIVGFANLMAGAAVQDALEALVHAGNGRLRGIRHGATWDDGSAAYGRTFGPRHMLLDPAFRLGFSRLSHLGLSFDAWLYYSQLPDLIDLLSAFPETSVILDHGGGLLGIPPHTNRREVFDVWSAHLAALARFPNLTIKVGGFGMLYGGWDFHLQDRPPASGLLADAWRPYVEKCIETFGPERCMFESNFPVDKQSCGYGQLWNAFKRITRDYSHDEKAALYSGTAARVYRLTPIDR